MHPKTYPGSVFWPTLALLLGAGTAHAQVCVDPAGGGCETTIQAGVNLATAGETVTVAAATYSETVTIPAGKDGLVISAKKAVLDNPSAIDGIVILSNNVTISGLTIRNARNGVTVGEKGVTDVSGITLLKMTFEAQDEVGVQIPGSDSVTVEGCTFNSCGDTCVESGDFDEDDRSNNVVLTKNRFRYCGSGCMQLYGDTNSAIGNRCTSIDGDCVRISGNDAIVEKTKGAQTDGLVNVQGDNPRVVKNKVRNFGNTAIYVSCTGNCAAGAIVDSNSARYTADDNGGFVIDASTPGLTVTNNTVYYSADAGFRLYGFGVLLDNNLTYGAGGDSYEHGIVIYGSDHVVTNNASIASASDGFAISSAINVSLEGNLARGNYGDGFSVGPYSTGVNLTNNTAENNIGEGFELDSLEDTEPVTATLTGNTATGNRVPFCVSVVAGGPVDGGGNSFTVAGAPACEVNH